MNQNGQSDFPLEQNGLGHITESTVRTTSQAGSCCTHQFNPCRQWSLLCSWWLRSLRHLIAILGGQVARRPLITVAICVAFASFCAIGFVWLKVENRTDKLFIPQTSQALDDLNTVEKFFRLRIRNEGIILVVRPGHHNILEPACLKEAMGVHLAVTEMPAYLELCESISGGRVNSTEECVTVTPFEIFNDNNFDSHSLEMIQTEITQALSNFSFLMSNGRPFNFNFNQIFGGVTKSDLTNKIIEAKALQLNYLIRHPLKNDETEAVYDWEQRFIDKLASLKPQCFGIYYEAERSTDDAIAESTLSDVTLISITFTLMISFACFMLGKLFNPLTGHSLLANAGILAVGLGILVGMGLAMWCGVTFVSMVGVVPFLVLGVGIDDMFIIVDELDRQPRDMDVVTTVKEVMSCTGATITMTTLTDLVAFAVSTSTSFPAIRYFCTYAALTVTFSYIMMVTFFVAVLTFDIKRIKAGRRDCLPFCAAPPPKNGQPPWDQPSPQVSNQLMKIWARFLMFPATKIVIIILSLAFLAVGIYGATLVDERFDRKILAKDDSYLKSFIAVQEEYFDQSIPVSVVLTGDEKYEEVARQDEIRKLSEIVTANKHYKDEVVSWMDSLVKFSRAMNMSLNGPHFMGTLQAFLGSPKFSVFNQDVKISETKDRVVASRILAFMKSSPSSTYQKNAMLTIREDLAKKSSLDVIAISRYFIFFEQYALITKETVRNLVIATLAVLIMTSFFLVDCTVTLLVVLNFISLVLELFGLMYFWDVSLNAVSMINLVMAIGFAVDYSAHIAHAYIMSEKEFPNERVIDALSTLGASVFMGGFSTFLGMTVLIFAASEIFRIFFRMFLGIVLFGLLHGLCFLPVYLSLFCWRPAVIQSDADHTPHLSDDAKDPLEIPKVDS